MVNLLKADTVVFKQGETNQIYPIVIRNADGTPADLRSFTTAVFKIISSKDRTTLVTAASVAINDQGATAPTETNLHSVDWTMAASETDIKDTEAGDDHIGHVEISDGTVIQMINPDVIVRVLKNKSKTVP